MKIPGDLHAYIHASSAPETKKRCIQYGSLFTCWGCLNEFVVRPENLLHFCSQDCLNLYSDLVLEQRWDAWT